MIKPPFNGSALEIKAELNQIQLFARFVFPALNPSNPRNSL